MNLVAWISSGRAWASNVHPQRADHAVVGEARKERTTKLCFVCIWDAFAAAGNCNDTPHCQTWILRPARHADLTRPFVLSKLNGDGLARPKVRKNQTQTSLHKQAES